MFTLSSPPFLPHQIHGVRRALFNIVAYISLSISMYLSIYLFIHLLVYIYVCVCVRQMAIQIRKSHVSLYPLIAHHISHSRSIRFETLKTFNKFQMCLYLP